MTERRDMSVAQFVLFVQLIGGLAGMLFGIAGAVIYLICGGRP